MSAARARAPWRRTVFISDVHLGSAHCHAAELSEFLERLQCGRLYLVGDIVDLWWMVQRRMFWAAPQNRSEEHTSELQSLMRISYAVFCLTKKKRTKETQWRATQKQSKPYTA